LNRISAEIQKYLNRRLYRELYTVSPQPVSLRSSGLPSSDNSRQRLKGWAAFKKTLDFQNNSATLPKGLLYFQKNIGD